MTTVTNGPVKIVQSVTADANNSSTTNLAVGNSYTFTGTATSTLGVALIQVSLFADKNCIVKVQQSPDSTPHWDISDTFIYTANSNNGSWDVRAENSYVRVVVTTASETTTTFRLQTALCPIGDPNPRSLDENGNFKIAIPVDSYGFEVENTPMGEMRTIEPYRLVGATFEGATIDGNFWTTAATGTAAAIAQGNAQLLLTSGTANAATVTAFSVRRARYVGGSAMRYRAVVQADAGTANNTRRWGIGWGSSAMPAVTDGAWFMLSGTTFQLQTMKGGTPTTITTFNGNLGATYSPGTTIKTYEIYWTNSKVFWVVGGDLLHVLSASSATWANTMNFHAFMDSVNSGTASLVTLAVRVATIYRLGKAETAPTYKNISGNAATWVIKYGPGILHKLIFNNTSGTSFIIYDNTSASAPIIGTVTTASNSLGSWAYDTPFFNGLTIVTTGNSLDMTVVYE